MKNRRLLVDTSAWIAGFRRDGPAELHALLREALDRDQVATTPLVVLELLQGCKTPQEFEALEARLASLEQLPLHDLNWQQLYRMGFGLRRRGVTVPTVDLLIAFLAMSHGYVLLHHDRHFRLLAAHVTLEAIDFLPRGP
ncbi:MAG: ribonuclease VapC [Candidatus Tectimicrobiota bacterium]|nr:MAG: ribonuclease VapC [Candidatus Tectomicrobia bacterium]